MKLTAVKIKNFRAYKTETTIKINDLTALIGKNDVGKSSILEALEIFFNNKSPKLESSDLNVYAASEGDNHIEITCVFSNLPDTVILDSSNQTTLADEHLLNSDGFLEIKKFFNCGLKSPSEKIFITAKHPSDSGCNDLLLLKQADLKKRAESLGVPEGYNRSINSEIRKAIWNHAAPITTQTIDIQVDKEDAKKIWDSIELWLPQFALFKSDRESNDEDKEVTDPMKLAVNSALSLMEPQLNEIQTRVREKAIEVATNTLQKLREMNPELASHLVPDFKSDPKWSGIFNLTLSSDNNIPINKRGSGVRRLIILNFFRAEAERKRVESNSKSIIYAFEEPENSQHPDHQIMLINAFKELSEAENTQVLLTTHHSALAGLIPENSLRLVKKNSTGDIGVYNNDFQEDIIREISKTLGMLPDPTKPKLLVCVEGPSDVIFLKKLNEVIREVKPDIIDLNNPMQVSIFPLGGGTLRQWVNNNYLEHLGIPQFHLYDLDDDNPPKYEGARDEVRQRNDGSWAELTKKREMENYIHADCINEVFGFNINYADNTDLPNLIARQVHGASGSQRSWEELDEDTKKDKESRVKRRLLNEALPKMNYERLTEIDSNSEVENWFVKMMECIDFVRPTASTSSL